MLTFVHKHAELDGQAGLYARTQGPTVSHMLQG